MKKKMIIWFVAGWLLAIFLPPNRVMGWLKGSKPA